MNYVIRQIDLELWRQVKARASSEGRSIRFVILQLLKLYAECGFTVIDVYAKTEQAVARRFPKNLS